MLLIRKFVGYGATTLGLGAIAALALVQSGEAAAPAATVSGQAPVSQIVVLAATPSAQCTAALNAIKPFLDADESAVGVAVDVKHLAATPVGHEVRATAEVVGVDGKRIDFKVSASDGDEEIGKGSHQRIVIDLRSFNERLAKKNL